MEAAHVLLALTNPILVHYGKAKGKGTRPMLLPRNKLRNVEQLRTESPFKTGLMRESCACYEPYWALSFCSFALWLSRRNAPLPSSRTMHLTVAATCCVTYRLKSGVT